MQQVKKVVLAYSGGVDTSVCIPYLKNEYGISEVVTFVADLGQGEDLEFIRQKALNSGASQSIVGNLVNSFVERYAFPAIRANALYLDKYPLSIGFDDLPSISSVSLRSVIHFERIEGRPLFESL